METIMKIPFLLATLAAIITGVVSLINKSSINQTSLRMIIAMITFYLLGLLISSTINNIIEEVNKQKREAEEKIKAEKRMEKINAEKSNNEEHLGSNLDLFAGNEIDDGFTPLDLSQAVKKKMKE